MPARRRRSRLLRLNDQLAGAGADVVGKFRRPAGVEIEIDAVLAEPRDLLPAARIGHPVNEAQRGIAEMRDAGLDQIRLLEAQRAGGPPPKLQSREAPPGLFP